MPNSGLVVDLACLMPDSRTRVEPTPRALLTEGAARLAAGQVETPRLDAEVLLRFLLRWDRARLFRDLQEPSPAATRASYAALIARRLAGEPVAYITGSREFMGLPLWVGPGVLSPRPETECLVEWLVAQAGAWLPGLSAPRIVDVGSGSGAIALALARFLPRARVVAIERSRAALPYVTANRDCLGLANRVLVARGDLLEPVDRADAIAANLPYLRPEQLHLGLAWEPEEALVGGADGLDGYRALVPQAAARLALPGLFAAEIDPAQVAPMLALCREAFPDAAVEARRDLAGLHRFVTVMRG